MSLYVNQLLFLCFLGMAVLIDSQERCNGGAACIDLQQCAAIAAQIPRRSKITVLLVRGLICDYNSQKEEIMICCPQVFLVDPEKTKDDPETLLPDTGVCGIQTDNRIYGGSVTELGEHPWMALIRYESIFSGTGYKCAGVLISSRYVLTAAHCVKGPKLLNTIVTQVRLGEWNLSSTNDCFMGQCSPPSLDVPIEDIIPHEDYDPSDLDQRNDIALLRLSQQITFTDYIKPICLPTGPVLRRNSFAGYDMEVAGWGLTELFERSNVKLKVGMSVVENEICRKIYKNINVNIHDTHICAGGVAGRDTCKGDSGGPLMGQVSVMNNWMAIGVVSFGPNICGTSGWPGAYTRVTAYIDWILSKLQP